MKSQALLGKATSVWVDTTPETDYPKLSGKKEVDVAIIGGGFAGIATAYFLTNLGKKVAIIEAFRIASATSGYTTAKVSSLHGLIYDFLLSHFGKEKAQIYANSNQWAIAEIENIITKEKIACDFMKDDAYTYANEEKHLKKIEKEVKAAKELGLPVSYETNLKNLPFTITSAVKFSDQARFNPRKFLLPLAKIIVKKGNLIFENSRANAIKEETREVITENGTIKAKDIVIATNYPFYDKGIFSLRMNQVRSYAFAVKIKGKLPNGMYLGVGNEDVSVRPYKTNAKEWLVIGGEGHVVGDGSDGKKHYLKLQERIKKLFPVTAIDYHWAAQDSSPLDRVPFIGRQNPLSKHIYVITGFDKWGITKSIVAAKTISDLITGKKNEWESLYNPSRSPLGASASKFAQIGKQVVKGFGKHLPLTTAGSVQGMKKNNGKVIEKNGKKIAVYKDKDGLLHSVSAVCTHLGCIVDFNKGEQTWDCPCHGSRFSKFGKVINGPAVKDLPKVKV